MITIPALIITARPRSHVEREWNEQRKVETLSQPWAESSSRCGEREGEDDAVLENKICLLGGSEKGFSVSMIVT